MTIRFLTPARLELNEAVTFYNERKPGLGDILFAEVTTSSKNLLDFPKLWPEIRKDFRRCRIRHFPYSLIYTIGASEVVVVAVMHDRQKPNYWRNRLQP